MIIRSLAARDLDGDRSRHSVVDRKAPSFVNSGSRPLGCTHMEQMECVIHVLHMCILVVSDQK